MNALEQLRALGAISLAPAPAAGASGADAAPFATAADLARFRLCGSERELVRAVAPLLREARELLSGEAVEPCAPELVDGEEAGRA